MVGVLLCGPFVAQVWPTRGPCIPARVGSDRWAPGPPSRLVRPSVAVACSLPSSAQGGWLRTWHRVARATHLSPGRWAQWIRAVVVAAEDDWSSGHDRRTPVSEPAKPTLPDVATSRCRPRVGANVGALSNVLAQGQDIGRVPNFKFSLGGVAGAAIGGAFGGAIPSLAGVLPAVARASTPRLGEALIGELSTAGPSSMGDVIGASIGSGGNPCGK